MHLTVHQTRLPLEDAALDHVHSSGVLHHTADPLLYLKEFYRLLRPGGTCRIMVYNRNSIWFHLYVAYQKMLVENVYAELSVDEAFGRFTDGEDCPVSRAYRPEEWLELCSQAGFEARYLGAAVSLHEADVFNRMRFQAAQDRRLPEESRRFLLSLTQDAQGLPLTDGHYAGVDACFELTR
jgi:SAM-dependent methyltransferase